MFCSVRVDTADEPLICVPLLMTPQLFFFLSIVCVAVCHIHSYSQYTTIHTETDCRDSIIFSLVVHLLSVLYCVARYGTFTIGNNVAVDDSLLLLLFFKCDYTSFRFCTRISFFKLFTLWLWSVLRWDKLRTSQFMYTFVHKRRINIKINEIVSHWNKSISLFSRRVLMIQFYQFLNNKFIHTHDIGP